MNAHANETQPLGAPQTGPVGRAARLLLAVGFAYGLATLVDQGGPASVRDRETLTDAPFVVLTIAMIAVYAILVSQLAKLVAGEAVTRTASRVALAVLAAATAVAALIGELRSGAVWGSPLSDLVWTIDVAMLVETIAALLLAVALGTRGCEIGVWADIAARVRGRPASPPIPLCIVGLHYLDDWALWRRSAPLANPLSQQTNRERRHMSNSSDIHTVEAPAPPADLKALGDRLVGTWRISGEAEGETTWEWMEGGYFLVQRGWSRREGAEQKYLQIIGHDRTPGSEPADAITGRLYTNRGDTLAYVCEVDGDTMTIWMGEKGAPAVYTGTFSADGNTIEGGWEWPGGGYKETMTRVHA